MVPMKIDGAAAPAMAISAPTDRSMPPVAITSVMPTPTMTIVQTWVRFTDSVCMVAKRGVNARLNAISSSSARSAPYRRAASDEPYLVARSVSHGIHDCGLADLVFAKLGNSRPLPQDEHPIGPFDDFLQFR
jgi:hypothetical protein